MSSRGWKLSAAIGVMGMAVAPAFAAGVTGFSPRLRAAMNEALYCVEVAATVYAEGSPHETAQTVADAALRKCARRLDAANMISLHEFISSAEREFGRALTAEERAKSNDASDLTNAISKNVEADIIEWRAQEKLTGANAFKEARERILSRAVAEGISATP